MRVVRLQAQPVEARADEVAVRAQNWTVGSFSRTGRSRSTDTVVTAAGGVAFTTGPGADAAESAAAAAADLVG